MNQQLQLAVDNLRAENRILKEQLGGKRLRLNDDHRRHLASKAKRANHQLLAQVATTLTPETVLAWHPKLIAQKYDGTEHHTPGRPFAAGEIKALVVRLAQEIREWGFRRIEGAVSNLGHGLARSRFAQILKRQGIDPSPERSRKTK